VVKVTQNGFSTIDQKSHDGGKKKTLDKNIKPLTSIFIITQYETINVTRWFLNLNLAT